MTAHKRLPNRRHAETFELTVGGLRYVCTVGCFVTAGSASCFSRNTKSNSTADTNARDAAAKLHHFVPPRVEGDAIHLQRVGFNHPPFAGTASPPRWLKCMCAQPLRSKLHRLHHPVSHHYAVVDAGGVQLHQVVRC